MKKRIISFCLAVALLFGMVSVCANAIVQQNPVHKESGTVEGKEDAHILHVVLIFETMNNSEFYVCFHFLSNS